jgi:hypothetical protein
MSNPAMKHHAFVLKNRELRLTILPQLLFLAKILGIAVHRIEALKFQQRR